MQVLKVLELKMLIQEKTFSENKEVKMRSLKCVKAQLLRRKPFYGSSLISLEMLGLLCLVNDVKKLDHHISEQQLYNDVCRFVM